MVTRGLTYQFLTEITDNFSKERELGEGAFGKVFRGVRKNGEEIAVKLLYNRLGLDNRQFQNELNNLMMLKHPNTVRFVGYCNETHQVPVEFKGRVVLADKTYRALCFECLHNGNLKRHLSDESGGLDWNTRYKIIKGICEGLKYIHKGMEKPIYHLDLKPENILLDKNMVPKLADFGLSKIPKEDKTRITANSYGTWGYIPPEYIERNIISNKFDIFSLGVIMIKIVTGHLGYNKSADMSDENFIRLAQGRWRNRLQANLNGCLLEAYCQQVKRCVELALNCVERERNKRPDIVSIIKKLSETENSINKAVKVDQQDKQSKMMMLIMINDVLSCVLRLSMLSKIGLFEFAGCIRKRFQQAQGKWMNWLQSKWNGCLLEQYCPQVKRSIELALDYVQKDKLCETEILIDELKVGQRDKEENAALSREEVMAIMEAIGLEVSGQRGDGLDAWMGYDELSSLFDCNEPSFDELKRTFAVFDNDRDGFISAVDLQFVLARLGVLEDAVTCHAMIVAAGGSSCNGRMDLIQFLQLLENGLRNDTDGGAQGRNGGGHRVPHKVL